MTPDTDRIHRLLADGARDHVYPGAVWALGDAAGTRARGTVGVLDPTGPQVPMPADAVFDVASLTKILAVWSTVGTLRQAGRLPLDEPLGDFWPEVAGHPLGRVTARNLLTHTAGVPPRAQLKELYGTDPAAIRAGVLREALHRPPGEAVEYTDRAALILGYLAEHLTGRPLDRLATTRIWSPLGMDATRFGPLPADLTARCAPTELDQDTGCHLKGTVHDVSARLLAGVCGIAGVFSTADDLARFLRHLLAPTAAATRAAFGPAWTEESLTVHTGQLEPARGLFWHPAPGTDLADGIWAHYGFTGTGMWISPGQRRWAVLLTNKVFHTRDRQPLTGIRNAFRGLAFGAAAPTRDRGPWAGDAGR
ncbi:serine hydrolase domain-containing protein [Kitasatospora sp. NPDC052896]|uniref:serine hydrolase domain-containing protein n=1 Tax=Kitasatospora sp. NPDC052896 TaxID=3364061 RepID=UPI0037C7891C